LEIASSRKGKKYPMESVPWNSAMHWRNYLGTILGPGPVFQIGKISVRTYMAHETTNPTKAAHLFGRVTLYLPIGVC
jgi:hypothetical protein